jgi:hypothetical protein
VCIGRGAHFRHVAAAIDDRRDRDDGNIGA